MVLGEKKTNAMVTETNHSRLLLKINTFGFLIYFIYKSNLNSS